MLSAFVTAVFLAETEVNTRISHSPLTLVVLLLYSFGENVSDSWGKYLTSLFQTCSLNQDGVWSYWE